MGTPCVSNEAIRRAYPPMGFRRIWKERRGPRRRITLVMICLTRETTAGMTVSAASSLKMM